MRCSPLQDYLVFMNNSPRAKREDLVFQFGTLKHQVRISLDAVKYLVEAGKTRKIHSIYLYYRRQTENIRSSASYYLLLLSKKLFFKYYGLLLIDTHVYFTLLRTFTVQSKLARIASSELLLEEGYKIVQQQQKRVLDLLDEIIETLENLPEEELENPNCKFPPPPPMPAMILKWWKK